MQEASVPQARILFRHSACILALFAFGLVVFAPAGPLLARPQPAVTPGDLMGRWAVSGETYSHIYSFDIAGTAELRLLIDAETVVWIGTGTFFVEGTTLTVRLDATASNTPLQQVFAIEAFDGTRMILRGRAPYFTDIHSPTVTLIRLPP